MTSCNPLFVRSTVPAEDPQRRGLRQNGFTLIELMIVVVVIAILATIAFPSYEQYVIRAKRSAAQAEMMTIANRQQQFFLANREYTDETGLGYTIPADLNGDYTAAVVANNAGTPPEFLITFTALGRQAKDGNLTLNSRGVKTPADKW